MTRLYKEAAVANGGGGGPEQEKELKRVLKSANQLKNVLKGAQVNVREKEKNKKCSLNSHFYLFVHHLPGVNQEADFGLFSQDMRSAPWFRAHKILF